MGILDDLKHKAEALGDKAREGFDAAKDKAGDLLDDAKDRAGDLVDDAKGRLGPHGDDSSPLAESSDVGPDTASTDAEQPGYVTAEDDEADAESDESAFDEDDTEDDADVSVAEEELLVSEPAGPAAAVPPAAAELDAEELAEDDATDLAAETDEAEPVVETDVDPYDTPLTETIGDEIAAAAVDQEAVAEAVDRTGKDASA